jgi:uncharacterized protein
MTVTLRMLVILVLAVALNACATNIVAEKASRFDQGIAAYDSGDYAAAYRIWAQLAKEDDLGAMRNAAQLLRQGKGVAKDSQAAFALYREAAEKGLVTAMANVAEMYLTGEGVEKNPQAAAAWYARAATAGLSLAQMRMSDFYEQGIGVERDLVRARALLERAARNGYGPAQMKLKATTSVVVDEPVTRAPHNVDLDEPWRGGGNATRYAGVASAAESSGPRMSLREPIDRQLAAKMPPADLAQLNAGLSAYAAQNESLAFASWRSVAERGNAEGQLRLGLLFARGEGTGQDMIEAYRWLKLAADQGHARAAGELSAVSAQLAPAERAIADSLVKLPAAEAPKAP